MPGWPLRNLLTLLNVRFGVERIKIICWKNEAGSGPDKSVVVEVEMAGGEAEQERYTSSQGSECLSFEFHVE